MDHVSRSDLVARAEHTLVIGRPPADVFAYLTEVRNLPAWQPSVVSVERPDEGPVDVGTRFTEVRKFVGRRLHTTMEVTEHAPGERLYLQVVEGPVRYRVTHDLEAVDDGTRVNVAVEGETGGFFALADGLVARQGERQLRADFGRLKAILEADD